MKKLVLAVCALAVLLALPGVAAAASNADPDRDGVDNRNERRQGTDPRQRDSDRDGRADGREDADRDGLDNATEDATGNDPVDRDSDDDGTRDGREGAGTVATFADGRLTLRLAGGTTVSGRVDELTDLTCPRESRYEHGQTRRGSSKAYRRRGGSRGKGDRRPASRAHGSTVPDDDGGGDSGDDPAGGDDDEDWGGDPAGGDEDWGGGESEDDGWAEDDDAADEDDDWYDDETEDATGPCVARLTGGARVHASKLETDEAGASFSAVELVR